MVINVSYTNVRYSMWVQSEENENIAGRLEGELNICDGRVTLARIAREIPKGAVVENITKVDKRFHVVGENLLEWLAKNGTEAAENGTEAAENGTEAAEK